MFDVNIIYSDVIRSIAALQGERRTVLNAGLLTQNMVHEVPFEKVNLSEYIISLPAMWTVVVGDGTLEEAVETVFRQTLYDRAIEQVLIFLQTDQGFEGSVFSELETVLTYLSRREPNFKWLKEHRSESAGNPISMCLARLRTFSTRIRQADRDRNEFRLLANALDDLDTILEKCGYDPLWAEHFKDVDVFLTRVRLLEKQCTMIWQGDLPLPPATLPSRFESIQQPELSARRLHLNKGGKFLTSFEAKYGMEPIKFVSVRESLKAHYRLMNPAIMQVLFDHFGLSAAAWADDFEVVSRDAKSSLRALKKLECDVMAKDELDPLVKRTFGKSQGLHNHSHVPDFTAPSERKAKRR
jgi:hypothetical protein